MSLQIYKPNDKNTGCACSFQFGVDLKKSEPVVFVNAIQQHGWDAKERVGSFTENANNPDKSLTIKLNEVECGEFISAFENRHEYSAYHDFDENKTSIKISPWDKKRKISVKDPKTKKYIGLDQRAEDAEVLGMDVKEVIKNQIEEKNRPIKEGKTTLIVEKIKAA